MSEQRLYHIDTWTLDVANNQLVSAEQTLSLEPKIVDLLVLLCENPHRTLSKEEILEEVWGGQHFTDSTISRAISILRTALGDSTRHPVFIKTIPRRGYRFIVTPKIETGTLKTDVLPVDGVYDSDEHRIFQGLKTRQAFIWVLSILLMMLVSWMAVNSRSGSDAAKRSEESIQLAQIERLVVLPLKPGLLMRESDFLVEGLHNEIAMMLARMGERDIFLLQAQGRVDQKKLIEQIKPSAILQGSVNQLGQKIEIQLRIQNAQNQAVMWAEKYVHPSNELVALRNEIITSVSQVMGSQATSVRKTLKTSDLAYQLYLTARWHWRQRTANHLLKAEQLFQQVLELDHEFTPAYAGLAETYITMVSYLVRGKENYQQAAKLVERALEIEPDNSESRLAQALIYYHKDWNFRAALEELAFVIEHEPGLVEALQVKAEILSITGQHDLAIETINQAVKTKPYDALLVGVKAMLYYAAGQYQESNLIMQELESLEPGFFWHYRYWSYVLLALGEEKAAFQKHLLKFKTSLSPSQYQQLVMLSVETHSPEFWDWQIARLTQQYPQQNAVSSALLAEAYAAKGDQAQAMFWAKQSAKFKGDGFPLVRVSPWLRGLALEPGYDQFLKSHNLPALITQEPKQVLKNP